APPSNGGQCVISVTAQGYRHTEIQRWAITGPPVATGANKLYPVTWSTSGSGVIHTTNGSLVRDASWQIAASGNVHFPSQIIASTGKRMVKQQEAGLSPFGALNGWQQQTDSNGPKPPGTLSAQRWEFGYPAFIRDPAETHITEAQQFPNMT